MAKNTVYNFLQSRPVLPRGIRLVKDTTLGSKSYCRLDIADTGGVSFLEDANTYTLSSHHISVYEHEDGSIAELSQYHYTAYFTDNEGLNYQLHVYFNKNDTLTKAPVFSIIDAAGSASPISSEALYSRFIDLTNSVSAPLMNHIRVALKEKISTLEARYKALEKEACRLMDVDLPDYKLYSAQLDDVCSVLSQLAPLVRHDHYQRCHQFIQKIKGIIEQPKAQALEKTDAITESLAVDMPASAAAPVAKRSSSPSVIILDSDITALCASYHELSREKDDVFTSGLVSALNKLYELSFQLGENGQSASSDSMLQLQKLHTELNHAVEQLYPRLLLGQKFELLKELRSFNYLISPKFLNLALQSHNILLLDFILTHGDFDLNYQPVTVGGKTYATAVSYCYENTNADCLRILIQHNASILERDAAGLPFAHTILSTPEHPLKEVLHDPSVNSVHFYKQLIAALTDCMHKGDLDRVACDTIKKHITVYTRKISALSNLSSSASASTCKLVTNKLEMDFGAVLHVDKLKFDEEYNSLADFLKEKTRVYLKTLSAGERRTFEAQSHAYLNKISEALSKSELSSLSYAMVRESGCAHLKLCIESVESRMRLTELNKQLSGPKGSMSKKIKRMARERDTLIVRINEIERSISTPINFALSRKDELDALKDLALSFQDLAESFKELGKKTLDDFSDESLDVSIEELSEQFEDIKKLCSSPTNSSARIGPGASTSGFFSKPNELISKLDLLIASLKGDDDPDRAKKPK